MTFGELQNDYPDFNPYAAVAQADEDEEDKSDDAETDAEDSAAKDNTPSVKHRSEEAIAKLENLEPATTELKNEKGFVPYISPLLYMPFFNSLSNGDTAYFGVGAFFIGTLPRLQMKQGYLYLDAFYFPEIKNYTGEFALITPLFGGSLDFLVSRNSINLNSQDDSKQFSIQNRVLFGYTLPIISREQYSIAKELDFITYAGTTISQTDAKAFSVTDKIAYCTHN